MKILTRKTQDKIISCLCANQIIFESISKDLKHDDFMALIKAGENELEIANDIGGIEAMHKIKIVTTAERYLKERRANENGNAVL